MKNLSRFLVGAGASANDEISGLLVIQRLVVTARLECSDWVLRHTLFKLYSRSLSCA